MVTLVNRAKMATATTGTGTVTLGSAVTGFQTFANAGVTNSMTVRYVIENGDAFEIGSGTYTASGTTLSRTVSESSNSNNLLVLSGSSEVFLTATAADLDAALQKSGGAMTGAITTNSTFDGRDVATDGTKLDGIEASATADQTAAEIRVLVESASDSNVFTDADHTKVNGIEASATADQTDAEIRTAVEAASDSNVFTDADHTKLNAIEASADVTDATNVTAAGALMDSEVTNLSEVKAFDASDYATSAQGTLATNALPKGGGAMTGAITTNSTFDGVDIATRDAILTSTTTTANAALPKGGGTVTGTTIFTHANLDLRADNARLMIEEADGTDIVWLGDHTGNGHGACFLYNHGGTATTQLKADSASTIGHGLTVNGNLAVTGTVDGRDVATDGTKLDGIETSADVTDTTNVTASGALMDSELTSIADVKALNQSVTSTATPTFARVKLTQLTVAANSSATTLDFGASNNFFVNMSADTTFTFSNLVSSIGSSGNIVIFQDGTGGRDFTLPSTARTPINGATIVQNTGAFDMSVMSYYVVASTVVLVNYIGDFA